MIEFHNKKKLDFAIKLSLIFLTIASVYLGFTNQFSMRLGSDLYPLVRAVDDFSIGVEPYRPSSTPKRIFYSFALFDFNKIKHLA